MQTPKLAISNGVGLLHNLAVRGRSARPKAFGVDGKGAKPKPKGQDKRQTCHRHGLRECWMIPRRLRISRGDGTQVQLQSNIYDNLIASGRRSGPLCAGLYVLCSMFIPDGD